MKRKYKPDDPITVINGSNWLVGKNGHVVKYLSKQDMDTLGFPPDDRKSNIAVCFPDIPLMSFPTYLDPKIPDEEKRWVYFNVKNLKPGHRPLTFEETIEKELSGFGHSMRPRMRLKQYPDRNDNLCILADCPNQASEHIWINVWGTGYRFHVCEQHMQQYKKCSCREDVPFKMKADEPETKKEDPEKSKAA